MPFNSNQRSRTAGNTTSLATTLAERPEHGGLDG